MGLPMSAASTPPAASRRPATLAGLGAILLWALLAPLGVAAAAVPPLLLTGLAFLVGGSVGLAVQAARGIPLAACLEVPWQAALLGIGSFLCYHVAYFTALRQLPPVEALLIINTWPLLIILLTALLPGEGARWHHLVGGCLGLVGAAIIVLARSGGGARHLLGYALAVAAALIWSGYSVLNRRLAAGATAQAVTTYCLVTGALACLTHLLLEPHRLPDATAWTAIVALGLGPVGAAFYLWDHGTRHGDLRILGASAYAAPLLGTLILVLLGLAPASPRLAVAALLIIGGAALASGDLVARTR